MKHTITRTDNSTVETTILELIYITENRETGNVIDWFHTYAEARAALAAYEAQDKKDGTHTPDFYDIQVINVAELKGSIK